MKKHCNFAFMNDHEKYMHRCFELAMNGLGNVAPNPMVGCVIVNQGKIIGEGFHCRYGDAHAEVNAVNSVEDKDLLKESTVYVSLEPCSHYGKTPPCADFLIKYQVKRVVVSNLDPNPLVSGKGIDKLKSAGIEVISGVLEDEGFDINKRFFTFFNQKRPYVILKWAQTLDGFMDVDRSEPGNNLNYWITNEKLKILVHKWRSEEAAIMVGTKTALNDNPQLNVRLWHGNQPLRIVLDENLELPENLHLLDQSIPTLIFTAQRTENKNNTTYIQLNFCNNPLQQILDYLYKLKVNSLIVEGGKELLLSFINQGLWDEARILTGNKTFEKGLKAPEISGDIISNQKIEDDNICVLKNIINS